LSDQRSTGHQSWTRGQKKLLFGLQVTWSKVISAAQTIRAGQEVKRSRSLKRRSPGPHTLGSGPDCLTGAACCAGTRTRVRWRAQRTTQSRCPLHAVHVAAMHVAAMHVAAMYVAAMHVAAMHVAARDWSARAYGRCGPGTPDRACMGAVDQAHLTAHVWVLWTRHT